MIDLIGTIGLGDKENRSKDILGRVYEYFLAKFASAEGKKGGQFYTPRCVVRVLVEMLSPYKGRVFDPCYSAAFCATTGLPSFKPVRPNGEFLSTHGTCRFNFWHCLFSGIIELGLCHWDGVVLIARQITF